MSLQYARNIERENWEGKEGLGQMSLYIKTFTQQQLDS